MNNLKIINGFLVTPDVLTGNAFEEIYNSVGFKEGRIYDEKTIARLPVVAASHPHYKKWLIRKRSCNNLLRYIKRRRNIRDILEIGCGNGWLTAQLASVTRGNVTGMDVNSLELGQAKKVFRFLPNLTFIEGDIRSGVLAEAKFDLIVFADSAQYFRSLHDILKTAITYLTLQGEIHIIDTYFYRQYDLATARRQSREYFDRIGFPEMSQFYFHHCINEFDSFRFSVLYNPDAWVNKLSIRRNPFHWLTIKNHYS